MAPGLRSVSSLLRPSIYRYERGFMGSRRVLDRHDGIAWLHPREPAHSAAKFAFDIESR
jgi:hypothetical protein